MDKDINIGIFGLGTVGCGVVKILQDNADLIRKRLGFGINIKKVFSRTSKCKNLITNYIYAKDYKELFDDDIDIVLELIGGIDVARKFVCQAIDNKKNIVSANKALFANHGFEIFSKAAQNGVKIGFEASVAGGVPIIKVITRDLMANNIKSIKAIVNGTCNYILSQMFETHESFETILNKAIKEGYAERDPSFDIDGIDSAQKMAILASISFNAKVEEKDVHVEGIRDIDFIDIDFAQKLGYRVKLLGIANSKDNKLLVRVAPYFIEQDNILAKVDGVYNAISVISDMTGQTTYVGKGAGSLPTASSVVADIIDIAKDIESGTVKDTFSARVFEKMEFVDIDSLESHFYIRFSVVDSVGVLSRIANVLSKYNISIKSVVQIGKGLDVVPLLVLTHKAKESNVKKAIREIEKNHQTIIKNGTVLIRVLD
ncbi:MAG: homoserine dehydrogenase [Desulfurella sp.]|uniref:homoserine dehydrogenase n=1 Tax=Desulfurella sp. TaxID=1962857 RepID=UPI003D0A89DE